MSIRDRTAEFCKRFGLRVPILLAPMAGVSAPALSIAVANAGGLGACGALLMSPAEIVQWASAVRAATSGPFQINLWISEPAAARDRVQEERVRKFLAEWGPAVAADAGDATPPDFSAQSEALLDVRPPIVSSVMGVYPASFVARLKSLGMAWFANVSTVAEAREAENAGADVVVVQGMEAGGHRGCFDGEKAEREMVGIDLSRAGGRRCCTDSGRRHRGHFRRPRCRGSARFGSFCHTDRNGIPAGTGGRHSSSLGDGAVYGVTGRHGGESSIQRTRRPQSRNRVCARRPVR